jgi:hypothetical protein
MPTTYRTSVVPYFCERCGGRVFAVHSTIGGAVFDFEASTDEAEQFAFRLREEPLVPAVRDVRTHGETIASLDLLDQPTARRLKSEGVALHRTHACQRQAVVEPGPKYPWVTA